MADLRAQVAAALAEKPATAGELALRLRVRRAAVDRVLRGDGFERADAPEGASRRATYWTVAAAGGKPSRPVLRAESEASVSQTAALLTVLADGEWHDHRSLYRLATVLPARIRELRRRGERLGFAIETRRDGRTYLYRLVPTLGEFHLRTVRASDVVELFRFGVWTPVVEHEDGDLQIIEYAAEPSVLRQLPAGRIVQPPWRVTRPGVFRISEPSDALDEQEHQLHDGCGRGTDGSSCSSSAKEETSS